MNMNTDEDEQRKHPMLRDHHSRAFVTFATFASTVLVVGVMKLSKGILLFHTEL